MCIYIDNKKVLVYIILLFYKALLPRNYDVQNVAHVILKKNNSQWVWNRKYPEIYKKSGNYFVYCKICSSYY
jgi:hypothetical protein